MKRLLLASLITAGLLCSATALHALAPGQLFKIPTSQLGSKIKTISSGNGTIAPTMLAFKSDSSFETAANLLTIPLYAYNPYLGAAASMCIGFAFDSPFDTKQAYDNNLLQTIPGIQQIIQQLWPNTVPLSAPGAIVSYNNLNYVQVTDWYFDTYQTLAGFNAYSSFGDTSYKRGGTSGSNLVVYRMDTNSPMPNNPSAFARYRSEWQLTTSEVNYPPQVTGPPQTLSDSQRQLLEQALNNALQNNSELTNQLKELIKSFPQLVQSPAPITNQDITNWATTNNYNTNQAYIDYLTNIYNSTTGDTQINAGIELEKAKAEQEKEQTEEAKETFSPIPDNPFTEPYNPGEYDIPARFTTFLNRVKSTGLFSFSADFFNSLPGGGSPIYEIEAGQYGHHTIDLSQTLTVGLAILKTILLACFGFLSIRAVIMKR